MTGCTPGIRVFVLTTVKKKRTLEFNIPKLQIPGSINFWVMRGIITDGSQLIFTFSFSIICSQSMLHECFCILRPSHQCKNAFLSGAFSFLGAARSRMGPSLNRELKNHRNSELCPKWQSYNQQNRGVFSSGCQVFELYSQDLGHNLCSYPLHTEIIFKMEFTASLLLSAGGQFLSHT